MIDLVKSYGKYEDKIRDYVLDRRDGYFQSECYKKLKSRIERINNSLDMRFASPNSRNRIQNSWKSKIAMPLMLEADINLKAMLLANFANPPIVSLNPLNETPYENAKNMEETLESNFKTTHFRPKAFNFSRLYASHYGTFVIVSQPVEDVRNVQSTRQTPLGFERMAVPIIRRNIINSAIHPLNYFQNPAVRDPEHSDYQGYLDRYFLADLMSMYKADKDLYIKKNIEFVFESAKREAVNEKKHFSGQASSYDYKQRAIDISKFYGTLNIKGNEDSLVEYEVWMAADRVIRFQVNPYDWDVRPLSIGTLSPRLEFWWGNSPIEYQSPYENFGTLFMQMAADEAMRRVENYIFYEKGSIDIADWNNRHKMGGAIPVSLKNKQMPHVIWDYQRRAADLQGTQYMLQEVKEAAQRVGIKSDLARQGLPGGPRNETATAALQLEAQGNMIANDVLKQFSMGIVNVGRVNAILLQQYALEEFNIRPRPKEQARRLIREQIMGEFDYEAETSLTANQQAVAMRLQNAITGMLNFKGTGDPTFQRLDPIMAKTVREWVRKLDLPSIDLDRDFPEQVQQQPMMPQQVGAMGGLETAEAPAPPPGQLPNMGV